MNYIISEIDSKRFGFRVAKISNDVTNIDQVLSKLKKLSTKMIIARVELSNLNLINNLEKYGFTQKDVQATFNFRLNREIPLHKNNDLVFLDYSDDCYKEVIELTARSFDGYGHYFADERLDKEKCREIYVDWIHHCCKDSTISDFFIVAKFNNKVAGYLALKKKEEVNGEFACGLIGAVSPEFRGHGVFNAINIESLYRARLMGMKRVENNVLLTNFRVMKTYTDLSYNIIRSEVTLHCWL